MPCRYGSKSSRNPCKHWLGTLSRLKRPLVAGGSVSRQRNVNLVNMLTQMLTQRLFQDPNVYAGCCTVAPENAASAGEGMRDGG
jgi:hypothetical protein